VGREVVGRHSDDVEDRREKGKLGSKTMAFVGVLEWSVVLCILGEIYRTRGNAKEPSLLLKERTIEFARSAHVVTTILRSDDELYQFS